jgi:hypothetical protein
VDKQLLYDIINGRMNRVLNFDFTPKEEEYEELQYMLEERFREISMRQGD